MNQRYIRKLNNAPFFNFIFSVFNSKVYQLFVETLLGRVKLVQGKDIKFSDIIVKKMD